MNDLINIGRKYGTDKIGHGYLDVYHEYFSKFRGKEINILEIGVYNGASMKVWREYFPNANIVGMDVEDKTRIFESLSGKSMFFLGDQGNPDVLENMAQEVKKKTGRGFDIIIDDGSHFQYDMIFSFGNLFPHLSSGGVYVIEDMCTANGVPGVAVAVGLKGGGPWWGPEERNSWLPGLKLSEQYDKQWLPNGEKDLFYCAETTMERMKETGILTSVFITEDQCQYVTDNSETVDFYRAKVPPIRGTSSIAVVVKK